MAYVELVALPVSVFWARRHAEAVLGAWQVPAHVIEIALLLVSELVTNAVAVTATRAREAEGPVLADATPIIHTLRRQSGRVVIEVSDPNPMPPLLTPAESDAESGRGLILVEALSKEWSYFFPPSGGKTVYCVIGTGV